MRAFVEQTFGPGGSRGYIAAGFCWDGVWWKLEYGRASWGKYFLARFLGFYISSQRWFNP